MRKTISLPELSNLLMFIAVNNSPIGGDRSKPIVKYVHPVVDMRTQTCGYIKLVGFGGNELEFHTTNDCRDLPKSLYERVMQYLRGESDNCEVCFGTKGGVKGNENRVGDPVNYRVMCDYCDSQFQAKRDCDTCEHRACEEKEPPCSGCNLTDESKPLFNNWQRAKSINIDVVNRFVDRR